MGPQRLCGTFHEYSSLWAKVNCIHGKCLTAFHPTGQGQGALTDLTAINLQSLEDLFETIQARLAHSKQGVVSLDLAEVGGPVTFCSI